MIITTILILPLYMMVMNFILKIQDSSLRIVNLGASIAILGQVLFFIWQSFLKHTHILMNIIEYQNFSSTTVQYIYNRLPYIKIANEGVDLTTNGSTLFTLTLGIDGISILFLLLTAIIFPFCFIAAWKIEKNVKTFLTCLQLLEFAIILAFLVQDLLLFYIFFEIILIPMFFIIINWGPNERKIKAGFYFFIYTFVGSILLLLAIFFIYAEIGTTNYLVVLQHHFSPTTQKYLGVLLIISFAIKIPIMPFHLWLPQAHVESPTIGSVILASLLLKLGGYGFIRFFVTICHDSIPYFKPTIYLFSIISIIYASFMAIRQVYIKRIIAYSSIAHMNEVILGIFTCSATGIAGSILLMFAHGLTSGALFFLVGALYDRYHTRLIKYYSGLVFTMPLFVIHMFIFTVANFSLPGTLNFIGELCIFLSLGDIQSWAILILVSFCTLFGLVYSLLLFNKISFGTLKVNFISTFSDLTRREFSYLSILALLVIAGGLYPQQLFSLIEASVQQICLHADTPNPTLISSDLVPNSRLIAGLKHTIYSILNSGSHIEFELLEETLMRLHVYTVGVELDPDWTIFRKIAIYSYYNENAFRFGLSEILNDSPEFVNRLIDARNAGASKYSEIIYDLLVKKYAHIDAETLNNLLLYCLYTVRTYEHTVGTDFYTQVELFSEIIDAIKNKSGQTSIETWKTILHGNDLILQEIETPPSLNPRADELLQKAEEAWKEAGNDINKFTFEPKDYIWARWLIK